MTPPTDPPSAGLAPDQRLATAFARHVARWAQEQGASSAARELAQQAAARLSQATTDGHSCLRLDELSDMTCHADGTALDRDAMRALLLQSRVVGTPAAPAGLPLILDDERLYLHRYFDYECRLAAGLAARSTARCDDDAAHPLPPNVVVLLDRLFAAAPEPVAANTVAVDWQKIAAITALLGRLTIISGGPGTGKTTTVVNLLACLLEADPDCRIALTAPTGKAAARMTEVIQQRAGHLPDALRARLPTESSTIHRLLGGTPDGGFRHHAGNELPIDVLVVDEASMLDLALAVHLIEAVPVAARIILLGDKDQLAAVESGAVFSELSAQPTFSPERTRALATLAGVASQTLQASARPRAPLQDSVIWLSRNYRFAADSAIGLLATGINDGNAAGVVARLADRTADADRSVAWIDDRGGMPSQQSVRAILDGYTRYVGTVRDHATDPVATAAAFGRFRVLCALRDGPWGVNALNLLIGTYCRRTLQHRLDLGFRSEWYPGRPIMVLRNDPVLKLFNGDIGIVLPDADDLLQVYFPADSGGFRAIAPPRLPQHETAFAMTVHKSQGSEFEEVLLVLPAEKNRVLTRELLYTAVTRARQRLTLVANTNVIAATIASATKRASGLLARLQSHPF